MKHDHDVILEPVVSEKSYDLIERTNTYTFLVDHRSNKTEVKQAIAQVDAVDAEYGSLLRTTTLWRNAKAQLVTGTQRAYNSRTIAFREYSNALDLIRETGQLYLYRDRAQFQKDAGGWALRQQHGMRVEFLDGLGIECLNQVH